ncbi:MAG TPA: ATP-binding protein [Vicinamibacterales bacterium]|nr:ATP-binding protein [Vicinamibacterales bacterium]
MNKSGARSYLLAIATIAAAVPLTRFTWPLFAAAPFAPIFGAVAVTSHFGSEAAGLTAVGLGALLAPIALGGGLHWDPRIVLFLGVGVFGAHVIASRKRTLRALRASEAELRATVAAQRQAALELERSEQKLRHAQKLDAIGQLVAGVAHNFNNLLTVTLGYTDLLLDRHPRGDADYENLQEIRQATSRGASLTRQLLAFGHKHDARRERIDLTRAVAGLRDLLRRLIREDIALEIHVPDHPIAIVADPHDVEQIVLNLVLNARDALPDGGTIQVDVERARIDAGNAPKDVAAEPGDYVRLHVRDDGVGMTPDVQQHLFEPFFTTKEVGQGTGLGLAFVHGIARQAGGFVLIETAPGKGTSVDVCFPAAAGAPIEPAPPRIVESTRAAVRSATVLLVEDEAIVRTMAERALSIAGYAVLAAATPNEAIAMFDKHASSIALLLTDVVMPEMSGPSLARRLSGTRPDLPVLFMSGYSDSIPASTEGTEHAAFLAKPFSPADLVSAVARLIASV